MVNKTLGKYELYEELGRGGFGAVFLAQDTSLDIKRAVKVLHPSFSKTPEFIERFRREARIAARLDHPYIVPVYEFGQDDGYYYISMKYIQAGSLKNILALEDYLDYPRALRVTRQIASALDYAYNQPEKIIHRDIKPGNVLFDKNPRTGNSDIARLADFGFAKAMAGSGGLNVSNSSILIGTPSYMPPEAWQQQKLTTAADVYSLGCLLFEMITGKVLFDGDSPDKIMTMHIVDGPNMPEHWPATVPNGFEQIILKALARKPEQRFQTAREFAIALETLTTSDSSTTQVFFQSDITARESAQQETETEAAAREQARRDAETIADEQAQRETEAAARERAAKRQSEAIDREQARRMATQEQFDLDQQIKQKLKKEKQIKLLTGLGLGAIILVIITIGLLTTKIFTLINAPESTQLILISTDSPKITQIEGSNLGNAIIEQVFNGSGKYEAGQNIKSGTDMLPEIAGVSISVELNGNNGNNSGKLYWFPQSSGILNFADFRMKPILKNGALYIRSENGNSEVSFNQPGITASLNKGQMIVMLTGAEINVFCFQGECQLQNSNGESRSVLAGDFITLDSAGNQWISVANSIAMQDQWDWNNKCNGCLGTVVSAPTGTPTPTEDTPIFNRPLPSTKKPNKPSDNGGDNTAVPTKDPNSR